MNHLFSTELCEERGYDVVACRSLQAARRAFEQFGRIQEIKEISVLTASNKFIFTTRSVPFHNEDPTIKWIGWFCEQQASVGGESLLLDGKLLSERLSASGRDRLQSIVCLHRNNEREPILTHDHKWYFIPWSLPAVKSEAVQELLALVSAIPPIRVRLRSGDCMIVDNRRMLHGRSNFADVTRKLVRFSVS